MHQNSPFELKNRKIFWGGGISPTAHPLGASILAPTALDLDAYGASAPGVTATGLMWS